MDDWFVPWPLDMPWIDAIAKGWYRKAGLDVKIQYPQGSAQPARLLGAGRVDMAVTYEPDTILTNAAGLHLKVLMALYNKTPGGIGFYKSSGIKKPKDLIGKTVAVYEDPFSQYNYKEFLQNNGIDPSQVHEAPAGADSSKLLIAGRAQAIQGADSLEFVEAEIAKPHDPIHEFDWNQDWGFPKLYSLLLDANGSWLKKNPSAAKKFVQVTQRAISWEEHNQKAAVNLYIKANPKNVNPKQARLGFPRLKLTWCGQTFTCWQKKKPIGWIAPSIWKGYAAFLVKGGLIQPAAAGDLSVLTNNKYLSKKYKPRQ
jgi:putative hydroxymethylpyrimidine transport system substrate-binding protein